jgi:hypothetical protein
LHHDWFYEDGHSALIKRYKKTFRLLAKGWLANSSISNADYDELAAVLSSNSWRIWRPVLYVIPRSPIETAGRLLPVVRPSRAAYGPELQIKDLMGSEFDAIER